MRAYLAPFTASSENLMKNAPILILAAAAMISCSGGSGSDSPAPQEQQQNEVKCQDQTPWQRPQTKAGDSQSQKIAKFISANLARVKATDVKALSRTYETCLKSVLEE